MNSDVQDQALKVTWKTAEISLKALKVLIETMLANKDKIQHGQQKLTTLNKQNKQLENVEITKEDIKAFKRRLNNYAVDFSVKKDPKTASYFVFFKAQDIERVYQGLKSCIQDIPASKKPIRQAMREAEEKANGKAKDPINTEKQKSIQREQDAR